jgi:hypothetical protein
MEKNVKKIQFLALMVIMAFLVMPLSVKGQGSKANFAGTWAFNAEKTTAANPSAGGGGGGGGGQRGGGGGNLTVKQEANLLTVDRTRTGQDGTPTTTTSKYTLDGKESVNTTARGDSKSVATWSADGKSITIKTTSTNGSGTTTTSTAVWSMTDAKTLSLVTTQPGRDGGAERKSTAVYDKK